MAEAINSQKMKQPPGLYLISFTSIWERFSYYGMRAMLILYMTNMIVSGNKDAHLGGLSLDSNTSGWIYGIFNGACYFLPLFGGMIADRLIGKRRSILWGGILIMIGHIILAINAGLIPNLGNFYLFIFGLTVLAVGNGFFKPNSSSMIGDLYEQGDPRRDSAYTIYYMLFNGGAFLAPIVCGLFGETYGYKYGFLTAAIGMFLGLMIYIIGAKKTLGNIGLAPVKVDKNEKKEISEPLTKQEIDRISVIFIMLFFAAFFWMGFEQAGTTLTLYTRDYIDRMVLGWEVPITWFQSINPIFILMLGSLFSWLWMALAKKGKNPSTPIKMGLGMLALGLGFVVLMGAVSQTQGAAAGTVKANALWMVGLYFMHTVGELCISPIGLSMVSKLAPAKYASLLMGTWFLSSAAALLTSGYSVTLVSQFGYMTTYTMIIIGAIGLGLIVFLGSRWLLRRMHGAD